MPLTEIIIYISIYVIINKLRFNSPCLQYVEQVSDWASLLFLSEDAPSYQSLQRSKPRPVQYQLALLSLTNTYKVSTCGTQPSPFWVWNVHYCFKCSYIITDFRTTLYRFLCIFIKQLQRVIFYVCIFGNFYYSILRSISFVFIWHNHKHYCLVSNKIDWT